MPVHPKSIFKFLVVALLTLSIGTSFAQSKKHKFPIAKHSNGLDPFPVFKATQKNSFIDSIIYKGPFITFCISFEKPSSDGHYLFEAVNSKHGWSCETARGNSNPILIKNIRQDGALVSTIVKDKPVDLKFYNKEKPNVRISCEIQFFRNDFVHGEATLSEAFSNRYSSKNITWVEFNNIRIRTNNYPKPLNKKFIENFEWARNESLEKIKFTVNEVPQKIFVQKLAQTPLPNNYFTPSYNVLKKSQNQLFLQGVWHTPEATVFRVQYYVFGDDLGYVSINLYNKKNQKYYIKIGSKKIKMRSIKNILINQCLIKEELQGKESLKLTEASALYLLTYDVYFDRLPEDLKTFDLIEGNQKENTTPFDFYSIQLNQ